MTVDGVVVPVDLLDPEVAAALEFAAEADATACIDLGVTVDPTGETFADADATLTACVTVDAVTDTSITLDGVDLALADGDGDGDGDGSGTGSGGGDGDGTGDGDGDGTPEGGNATLPASSTDAVSGTGSTSGALPLLLGVLMAAALGGLLIGRRSLGARSR